MLLIWKWMALEEKSSGKILGLTFSSTLDWGSYIISISITTSQKTGPLIHSMKFLSPEVALYLYKSNIWPCIEYCCHVWAGDPNCFFGIWNLCSSELAQLVPPPYSRGRSTGYSDRSRDFAATIPSCYKDVYINNFLPCTARLWNSLPIECFPLTYDLNGFKSRINR